MRELGENDVFTPKHIESAMAYVRKNYDGMESQSIMGSLESMMEQTKSGILIPKQGILRPATRPMSSNWN
jgi:hypothetical protein